MVSGVMGLGAPGVEKNRTVAPLVAKRSPARAILILFIYISREMSQLIVSDFVAI